MIATRVLPEVRCRVLTEVPSAPVDNRHETIGRVLRTHREGTPTSTPSRKYSRRDISSNQTIYCLGPTSLTSSSEGARS